MSTTKWVLPSILYMSNDPPSVPFHDGTRYKINAIRLPSSSSSWHSSTSKRTVNRLYFVVYQLVSITDIGNILSNLKLTIYVVFFFLILMNDRGLAGI